MLRELAHATAVAGLVLAVQVPAHAQQPPPDIDFGCSDLFCQTEIVVPGRDPSPDRDPRNDDAPSESSRPRPAPMPLPDFAELPSQIASEDQYSEAYEQTRCVVGSSADCLPLRAGGEPVLDEFGREVGVDPFPAQPGTGAPAAVPQVDPAVLAQRAIGALELVAPPIRMSPPPGSEGATLGFPVWMWLEPGAASTGPISESVSAGGITVTATATLDRVVWDMGDGTSVTCVGSGTPFSLNQAGAESPDCGHVYTVRSPGVTVTATSVWLVEWEGGGEAGAATLQPDAQVVLPVREVRTVNSRGDS